MSVVLCTSHHPVNTLTWQCFLLINGDYQHLTFLDIGKSVPHTDQSFLDFMQYFGKRLQKFSLRRILDPPGRVVNVDG